MLAGLSQASVGVSASSGLGCFCFTGAVLLAGPLILFAKPRLPEHVLIRMTGPRVSGSTQVFLMTKLRMGTLLNGPHSKKFTWLGADSRVENRFHLYNERATKSYVPGCRYREW